MTALVLLGLVAVVLIAMAWSRVGLARSERRSMRSYQRNLNALGDVARRSEAPARVRPVPPGQPEHGHLGSGSPAPLPERGPQAPATRARGPAAASPFSRVPADDEATGPIPKPRLVDVPVHFEDDSASPAGPGDTAAVPATTSRRAPEGVLRRRPVRSPSTPVVQGGREIAWGRLGGVAAVVVALAALVLGGVHLLASHHSLRPAGRHDAPATHPSAPSSTSAPKRPSTTTTPTVLVPVSTSPTDVAFVAPKGSYTVVMADNGGLCWVGIQQTSGGPYIWQDTLGAGQTTSYRASGPLVIRIGAPRFLGVKVNGVPVRLPGFAQPYDVTFNPSSPPSSA